jgi:hypothetical protein
MKRAVGLLGLVVLLCASTASAEEREAPERSWYGYQTLSADGLAITMTGLGVKAAIHEGGFDDGSSHTTSKFLLIGGAMGYLFASPTIHALHGHWGKAGASLGLRTAPIALGAGIFAMGGESGQSVGASVLIVGILTALVVDSALVANENVPPPPKVSLAPTFDPKSGAAGVAFAATF